LLLRRIKFFGLIYSLVPAAVFNLACSLAWQIPTVADAPVEELVNHEAQRILAVADPGSDAQLYRFQLAPFPRADLLGVSIGHKRIYINYRLAQLARENSYYRWLLRQTLAHEIAHELAGHANQKDAVANRLPVGSGVTASELGLDATLRFDNYSVENELQADLFGMNYWDRLGWDCRIWVAILNNFQKHNYSGDALHPTDRRLAQAATHCAATRKVSQIPTAETTAVSSSH
jgi:predicted Zn-dependent protease